METFIKIVQLLLSLSILVILHEFGHFSFAKLFKTRVEKFYLFFNPWFQIYKKKIGETEYGIGWLPLGGYVKIAGMIDESMDKEQMKQPPQPWEFRSKKPWQRLLIMIGGVLMNFILAGIIYIAILFAWGEDYLPSENVKYGISVDSAAYQIGFRNGDKILSVNNQTFERFNELKKEMVLNSNKTVQVLRNGEKKDIFIDDKFALKASKHDFVQPRFAFVIADFSKNSNAEKAGIKKDDKLIGINDSSLQFFDQYVHYFKTHKKTIANLKVDRKGSIITIPVQVDSSGMIGIAAESYAGLEFKHIDFSFFASIPAGINKGIELTSDYLRSFKLIFNSETKAYKSVGSFITIGNMFPGVWDWQAFWTMTAFLSIILGVVNLLPIPALDGGHVMFVLYEMITRRKPGDKFMEYAQITGFVILLAIMVLALKNDIVNFFF
ncbi:MAG: RIP metalloprotease RseP [Bacteroidetes bacterium]|nr:MAG: RIP metalloprotease RseP [Bacteroidota bacterium]